MALVYATDLQMFDTKTAEDAEPMHVIESIARWACVEDPMSDGEHPARNGGIASISVVSVDGSLAGWRLSLAHADSLEPDVTWTATASVTTIEGTRFTVRLDRTREGPLRPLASNPAPPRLVSELLADDSLFAMDSTWDVQAMHYLITEEKVDRFAAFLLDPERRLPVVGLTARDDDVFDASEFVRDNVGVAHVALIRPEATWTLSALLPDRIAVYGGAARLWWPGLDKNSSRWDHPLWTGDRNAGQVRRQVSDRIRDAATTSGAEDRLWVRLARERRRRELDGFRTEAERLSQLLLTDPANPSAVGVAGASDAELKRALDQARAATSLFEGAEAEIELERLRADAEKARADETERRLRQVISERDVYKQRLREVGSGSAASGDSVEDQLRRDILVAIRESSGEARREFVFGAQFANSLESLGGRYWDKAIKTCAAVVTGSPDRLASVDDHELRSGDGPKDPQQVRPRDGARARRAALEQHTASARRLHYWVLSENVVEFASTGIHDDFSIPV